MASYVGLTCPCNPSRWGNCSCRLTWPTTLFYTRFSTVFQNLKLIASSWRSLTFAESPPLAPSLICCSYRNSPPKGLVIRTEMCNCTPHYLAIGNFILVPCYSCCLLPSASRYLVNPDSGKQPTHELFSVVSLSMLSHCCWCWCCNAVQVGDIFSYRITACWNNSAAL